MKNFLLLLVILFGQAGFASERPIWEENCPEGLHDAVYKEIQWFWPESTKATQEIYNYWAKRRIEFYNAVEQCDNLATDFKEACYGRILSKQEVENEMYKLKFEQKKISSQIWRDTNKMTSPVMFNILSK